MSTGRKVNSMSCKVRMRVPALLLFCAALTATMSQGHAQEITIYNAQHRSLTAEWVEGFTHDTGVKVMIRNGDDTELGMLNHAHCGRILSEERIGPRG
jgi:hypothetical protein